MEADLVESDITETLSQPEDTKAILESDVQEEAEHIVQNEFFSVSLDSMTEEDGNVTITLLFTNVSDISYYKGDEKYHPGDTLVFMSQMHKNYFPVEFDMKWMKN